MPVKMVKEYYLTLIKRGITQDVDFRSRSYSKTFAEAGKLMAENANVLAVLIHSSENTQIVIKRKKVEI